jgi:tetratricopeptide (TPR) repeat protein
MGEMKRYSFFLFLISSLPFLFYPSPSFAQTGSVYITSKPRGANIWLDRNEIEKKTDTLIENIPTGTHRIAAEHREYGKIEKNVDIREDLTATVHFNLLSGGRQEESAGETEDAESYHSRGFTHFSKSQYDLALADFNKAIELDPASLVAYHNRGVVYFDLGRLPPAIADFTKAIDLGLTGKGSYHLRGVALGKQGQYDLAIEDLNKALEIDPKDASIYTNRGILYLLKGHFKQTISDLTKAIELGPKDPALYYFHLGFVFHKTGDTESAGQNFSKAKEVDPGIIEKSYDLMGKAGNPETKRFYAEEILTAAQYVEVQPLLLTRVKGMGENSPPKALSSSLPSPSAPDSLKKNSSLTWILILIAAFIVVLLLLLIVIRFSSSKSPKEG